MDSYMSMSFLSKNVQGTPGILMALVAGLEGGPPRHLSDEQSQADAGTRGPVLPRGRGGSEVSARREPESASGSR